MKKALLITVLVLLAVAIGIYAYNTKNSQMTQLSETPEALDPQAEADTISPDDVKVLLHTSLGDITILLYGDTPRHRDNFIKRVEKGD